MEIDNYKKFQELLEKWKNFSKVYDAIFEAYKLGYDDGVKTEKESYQMAKTELIRMNKIPKAI